MARHRLRRTEANLTSAQLEIMNLFWEHGELGVAQVWKLLSERRRLARNTVQTMLTRLVEKGWLQARSEGTAFCFRASRPRKSTLRGMVSQLLDNAFGGSASGLIMALLEAKRLSPDEVQRIRSLIDEMQEAKK
ncbi:MAG: BlaI/MecI/CopY family transcriptional regulator [Terriglobales bacterium]